MRHIVVSIGVVLLAALGFALASPAAADDSSDLAARAEAWMTAYNAGDMEGAAALYAEGGCRMPPNAEAVQGRSAILANLQATLATGATHAEIAVTEAGSSGDWGWGRGTYVLTGADGTHIDHGKWMNVSHQVDGKWMIHCDIWNSDMPLAGGETE
jgi:uncharacterized protein (TIGR02246 family)